MIKSLLKSISKQKFIVGIFILLSTLVLFPSCKKETVIQHTSSTGKETITLMEVYKWTNAFLNAMSHQHSFIFSSAEQSVYNGRLYIRVPVKGSYGHFYFTKGDNGIIQSTFIRVWGDNSKKQFDGHVEFANFTNRIYQIVSYHNNKPDSIFTLKKPGLYFNKIFKNQSENLHVAVNSLDKPPVEISLYSSDPIPCPNPSSSSGGGFWDWLAGIFGSVFDFFADLFATTDAEPRGGGAYLGASSISWYSSNGTLYYNEGDATSPSWKPVSGGMTTTPYYDPNNPYNIANNPPTSNFPKEPILNRGFVISDVDIPITRPSRLIASTTPRGNVEDLQYGTNGDITGIRADVLGLSDNDLFNNMTALFHKTTIFGLLNAGDAFIQRFKSCVGGQYSNSDLNDAVKLSGQFANFAGKFGDSLRNKLDLAGGNINNVATFTIDNKQRIIFNNISDVLDGLKILLNDTEYTEVFLDQFNSGPNGTWDAYITIVIHDHFGLDKNDVLKYQNVPLEIGLGFASWWLLQHVRNYVPFETIVRVQRKLSLVAVP